MSSDAPLDRRDYVSIFPVSATPIGFRIALSLASSMQFGFTIVGYASAAMYVVAWLCLKRTTPTS